MFFENKKKRGMTESRQSQNIIAQSTKIIGDFSSQGDLRIDGTVEGHVKVSGKVVVGKSGLIKGTLDGSDAYFEGSFSGKLVLSGTLTLKSSARIEGEVVVGKLAVEPGAIFDVTCAMKGSQKEANKNDKQQKPKKA